MLINRYKLAARWGRQCLRVHQRGMSLSIKEAALDGTLDSIDLENYRTHVDHGKSTLADAILQSTGNIDENERKRGQVLDSLRVERERGITVKAQTASMLYNDDRTGKTYLLNLIDTPGHVDFSYEVIRSLASCQGALLLVDSSQSVQAQTLANHGNAKALGLALIPVVTKIDLPSAQPEETALNMSTTFDFDPDDCIMTSAREKIGIDEILQVIVDKLPPPTGDCNLDEPNLKARIVDSWFEEHRGMVCLVQVVSGELREGMRITTYASVAEAESKTTDFSVQEVGLLTPTTLRTKCLRTGQVGYVVSGMRSTRQARIGDTVYSPSQWQQSGATMQPLEGYEPAKQMLFASVFPVDTLETELLYSSVDRLCLNDSSVSVAKDQSLSLGSGLRCGFLGFLHMEVFMQRLRDEFDINVIMTSPSVPYIVQYSNGETKEVSTVDEFPIGSKKQDDFKVLEPYVKVVLVTPSDYYGPMVEILKDKRAEEMDIVYLDDGTITITALMPWQEVVCDMSDMVKQRSSGYANFNYTTDVYKESWLSKVEVAVNGEVCEALSFISHKSKAASQGRKVAAKLKEKLDRQQFEIVIQAKVGSKILCRERIAPYRKDVLDNGKGGVVGQGDVTRKKKLLQKQKEGKQRAKMVGKVEISQEAFWSVLNRE